MPSRQTYVCCFTLEVFSYGAFKFTAKEPAEKQSINQSINQSLVLFERFKIKLMSRISIISLSMQFHASAAITLVTTPDSQGPLVLLVLSPTRTSSTVGFIAYQDL